MEQEDALAEMAVVQRLRQNLLASPDTLQVPTYPRWKTRKILASKFWKTCEIPGWTSLALGWVLKLTL
jgi:hypothetical protein